MKLQVISSERSEMGSTMTSESRLAVVREVAVYDVANRASRERAF